MAVSEEDQIWNDVHYPIQPSDPLPPERKVVLVWLAGFALPFCGYIRYASGDKQCPYFVVYHGNPNKGAEVIAWCDCLPDHGPNRNEASMYNTEQKNGRGYPARRAAKGGGA